jgi:hypothetical protein
MRNWVLAVAVLGSLSAAALAAKPPKKAEERPEAFEALVRCRSIQENEARLRCFDSAAAGLQQAAEARELVVVDRKQIQEAKRSLFGLDIPNLNPFGGGGDEGEEVKSIESVVASASTDGGGRWIVRLEDGSTWVQTDYNQLAVAPKRGHKVKITRASLGSYMMRVNGQPGVRAKRQV